MTTNVFNCFWNIQGIGVFFRDMRTRTLKEDVVEQLHENILILLYNLEKIFPLAFFYVIEPLVVHLPYEALLHGHIHYGWMYQYERCGNRNSHCRFPFKLGK